jgi:glycosyltransferase involved in cell wall biosynthesis
MGTKNKRPHLKILVLIHEYPPVGGGGGRVAQDICSGLVARGHEVRVLTSRLKGQSAEEEHNGVLIKRLHSLRRFPFRADMPAMIGYVLASLLAGQWEIWTWRPDVIHIHFAVPAGAPGLVLSKLNRIPYVLTAHLGDVPGGVPEKTGRWFRWIFPFTPPIWKSAARLVAVSEFTAKLARQNYPVEPLVIPNGVDLAALDPGKIRLGNPPQVAFAGRFMPQKNPLLLVRALAGVADLPWQCVMAGDGPLMPEVKAEIEALGLKDRIFLPGWVMPEQVIEHFRLSDILCMPSLSEGLPVVGVQAKALGLALVLSNAGGNPEVVEEGLNGYLLEPDDLEGFQKALRSLLSDPQKLLAYRKSSRVLASRFDLKRIVDGYEQVLKAAAKK